MTCGASNVSFGMPDRHTLGAAWLPMAMTAGLTSAIMDTRTPQIVEAVKAADVFLDHDEWGMAWIAAHRAPRRPRRHERRRPVSEDPDGVPRRRLLAGRLRREGLLAPAGRRAGRARRHRPGRPVVHRARPRRRADRPRQVRVPPGRHRLRLRVVERHRDRLHLRRPRHLPQVQGAASRATHAGHPPRRAGPSRRDQLDDGWRLACLVSATRDLVVDVPPLTTRPKAATVGVGRQVILRPGDPEAVRRAGRADARRPAHRPGPAARRRSTTSSRSPTCTCCAGCRRCCARPTSRSPRWSSTRR